MPLKNQSERKNELYNNAVIVMGIMVLAVGEWICHRKTPFMMDDLGYATNLRTNQPLGSFADVIESQVWHFLKWGGRCVTHGLLQLILMAGEFTADILNMVAVSLLAWMICVTAGWRRPFCFLCASSLLVALNANAKMSMFWQAGTLNYVYSSVWILAFLWPYMRLLELPESRDMPLVNLWIPLLGLMAGWSNENMGPACLVVTAGTAAYLAKWQKRKVCFWMVSGSGACLIGSILVVAAPGNFVRASAIEKLSLGAFLYDRFFSMLRAGTDYLFPTAVLLAALLLFWTVCMKEKLRPAQWMLLALVILSYGAMVLSPHYPDRATFGTMVTCIVLAMSVLKGMLEKRRELETYVGGMAFCFWGYALYVLGTMQ